MKKYRVTKQFTSGPMMGREVVIETNTLYVVGRHYTRVKTDSYLVTNVETEWADRECARIACSALNLPVDTVKTPVEWVQALADAYLEGNARVLVDALINAILLGADLPPAKLLESLEEIRAAMD